MLSRREFIEKTTTGALGFALMGTAFYTGCKSNAEPGVNLKEAMFYDKLNNKAVQCKLCPRKCKLVDGQVGVCRARKNIGGKLYSLVYGKPVAVHVDPIEKKPFYHFLPGVRAYSLATVGCNLRCVFCQNWEISQASPGDVPEYKGLPETIVKKAKSGKIPVIACTYTEPIIFSEYMKDIAILGNKNKIRTVMISAGFINTGPLKEICKVLSGIKIDLKSISDRFYRDLTGGRLKPVLNTLMTIKKQGVWLEIVNLVIPGKNDSPKEIRKMCSWIKKNLGDDVPLHFTRFIPMYKLKNIPPTPEKTLEKARKIGIDEGLKYVYVGNIPGHPGNHTYCPKCGEILIKRLGYFVREVNFKNGKCKKCGTSIPGVWK